MRKLAITLILASLAAAQKPALQFAEAPKLVSCEPATVVPCFRAKLNIVDDQGKPLGVPLPPPEKIRGQIKVRAGESELNPFYVEKAGESQSKVKGRAALIIVDNSGSMNKKLQTGESRFEAAQRAVEHFLAGFEEGADRVAVVPFESHQVQEKIAAASFVRSKEAALNQVRALPAPLDKNNTALFSSVVFGVETLHAMLPRLEQEAGDGLDTMVVLLTDGDNDVGGKTDDAGLLAGPAGLAQAAEKVRTTGIPVHAIGFSDTGGLDEDALRRISTKYLAASNIDSLKSAFAFTRTLLNSRLSLAFRSPLPDRASLAGRNLPVTIELTLPDGRKATSPEAVWSAPQMGVPVYSGKCTPDEMKAVLNTAVEASWMSIVRPVLVFCGLGLLLLVLWHWVPRLVWPDQYMGKIPVNAKWSGQTQVADGVLKGRPAPPGFEAGPKGVNMGPRNAQDRTVVNPAVHPDFSKTRLGHRENDGPGGR